MILNAIIIILMLLISKKDIGICAGLPGLGDIQTLSNFANDAIAVLQGDLSVTALLTGSTGPTLDKVLDSVTHISKQLDEFGDQFRAQLDEHAERVDARFDEINTKLDEILIDLPLGEKTFILTRELHSYMIRIDNLYAKYERFSTGREKFNNYTIKNFIDSATSNRRGDLDDTLSLMFALLVPERSAQVTNGIFDVMAEHMIRTADSICGTRNSAQIKLFHIYESIIITETRGFIMAIFAYSLLAVFERSSFATEVDFLLDQFINRCTYYLKIAAYTMKGLPQNIELCDAPKYVEGIEYVKLSKIDSTAVEESSMIIWERKADIYNNMVVSGIRFTKKNDKLIEFQIKEGKLLPQGIVDNRNHTWQKMVKIDYSHAVDYVFKTQDGILLWGDNFIDFSSKGHDKISVGDVMLPQGYVLAGVAFQNDNTALNLRITGIKFDFTTGKLDPDDLKIVKLDGTFASIFKGQNNIMRKNPTASKKNYVDTSHNMLVEIGYTTDTTNIVAPFFDARSVEMGAVGFALTGLGLYHRGSFNYGGYFNFRLFAIDLSEYVKY